MANVRHLTILLALLLAPALARADVGYKVVANPAVPTSAVSREELSRIFLKKVTRWGGGGEIKVVDLRAGDVKHAFARDVHGKTLEALHDYWTQMIFSGRDVPPVQKGTDDQVLAYVREHPGAIGYVSATVNTAGVKVIDVRR